MAQHLCRRILEDAGKLAKLNQKIFKSIKIVETKKDKIILKIETK